jgi:glycine betaine/proline transport system substrate-binding protein
MGIRIDRRTFAAGIAAAGALGAAPSARTADAGTVRVAEIGLSFYRVASAVLAETLERLGHRVEAEAGAHDEMFPRVADGAFDLLCAAWLPGAHAHLMATAADRLEELGTLYEDAALYWAVPAYVPEEAVRSIADLARPEVAARMDRRIRSIGPSAGLSVRGLRAMELYGLAAHGYSFEPGAPADWIAGFREAHDAGRWTVMPLWRPQWLNAAYALRPLEDPLGAYPPPDRCVLLGNRAAVARLPERTRRVLRRMSIGIDGVTAMDLEVGGRGRAPREAARAWMAANAARVDAWSA